jgi:hypothetical protein
MDIKQQIALFCAEADKRSVDYFHMMNYTFIQPPTHQAEFISDKWARIVTVDSQRSAYAFVALQDGQTKTLGVIKAGDIHKPATWKAPAKHKRGNVFLPDFGSPFTATGHIAYLK